MGNIKEVRYHECNGLQTKCPYGMKEALYNSLTSTEPSSYGDIYVGSIACMRCKHYAGVGSYCHKLGTSWYLSVNCRHE
jgi:hypothetical protein